MATTIFKVVDFYRNNSINETISNNNSNSTNLGFNVTGGYESDIPATIFNIKKELLIKIDEGDIIVEINGINTRHLTLHEVLKQLRCCGNRVFLKLKSDPEYKIRFKQHQHSTIIEPHIPSSTSFISPLKSPYKLKISSITTNNLSLSTTSSLLQTENVNYLRNASKSYDNYINNNNSSNDINENNINVNSLITIPLNVDNNDDDNDDDDDKICKPIQQCQPIIIKQSTSLSPSSSSSSSSSSSQNTSTSESLTNIMTNTYDNNINYDDYNNNNLLDQQQILIIPQQQQQPQNNNNNTFQIEIDEPTKRKMDEKLKDCSSESDSEINIYTPKAVDIPSAQRLAKRLFYLDGFKSNDVVRHLAKKNDFSQLVADEYLKLFNFQGLTLDSALRKFLKQFQLVGEATEKERVLMYFAKHFVDLNETVFKDVDTCHTLTCAIMLLNTDLHDNKVQNKMTLIEFIENLKGLNDGENFSDELLESLYNAIKNEPLECAPTDIEEMPLEGRVGNLNNATNGGYQLRPIGCNPFLQLPDPHLAKEYKIGWLLRKCCTEADGKKAPFLKRSWKMFYASLRDMVLYLHKDDKGFKTNSFDNISNAIRIHHAHATVANDYKKKQFVFRLKTADWAEYLFQTSNTCELNEWVNIINLVASMFSSPPLASAVGSAKTFQRPLLPVSITRYTLQEQLDYHKKHIKQIQYDLNKLETTKDEKSFEKDKYNYYVFENQRYSTYLKLLEGKLNEELNHNNNLDNNDNNKDISTLCNDIDTSPSTTVNTTKKFINNTYVN